jgi:thermostable 8-oxoguanine DNA glycosylase
MGDDDLTFDIKEPGLSEITELYRSLWKRANKDLETRLNNAYTHMAERSKFCIEFYRKLEEVKNIIDDDNHTELVKDIEQFLKDKKYW